MKKTLMLVLVAVGIGAAILLSCQSYEVASPATFVASPQAMLIEDGNEVSEIDLQPIRSAISNSTWTSDSYLNKGSYHLKIEGSPDVYVSYYGGFFWIENQSGSYRVRDQDREAFQKFFGKVLEDELIPWRERRNKIGEQGSGGDP